MKKKLSAWSVALIAVLAAAVLAGILFLANRPAGMLRTLLGTTSRHLVVKVDTEHDCLLLTTDGETERASYYLVEACGLDKAPLLDENGREIGLEDFARGDYVDVCTSGNVLLIFPERYKEVYSVRRTGETNEALGQAAWQYYQGRFTSSASQPEPEQQDEGTVRWEADLDGDGQPEAILFDRDTMEREGFTQLVVEKADGTQLYAADLSNAHVAWNTFALYTDEAGRTYLLHYLPYLSTGEGEYSYELFSFDAEGNIVTKSSDLVHFSVGMPYSAPDNDVDALVAFTEEANRLWENAALLVTTDVNVMDGLYGDTYQPQDDADYVLGDPEEPVRYCETMWWSFYLTDEIPEYKTAFEAATPENLRQRLEAGNEVLARHRAEVEAQQAAS